MEVKHKCIALTGEAISPAHLDEDRIGSEVHDASSSRADEQDDAYMPQQMSRRLRPIQVWICLLFFVEGLLGLFVVGWPALSLCVLGTIYMACADRRSTPPETG
jgi:hypothetical protein